MKNMRMIKSTSSWTTKPNYPWEWKVMKITIMMWYLMMVIYDAIIFIYHYQLFINVAPNLKQTAFVHSRVTILTVIA